VKMGSRNN